MFKAIYLSTSLYLLLAGSSYAAILEVSDDEFGIPSDLFLQVEALGVMENDLLDDESAGESGVEVSLISDVSHGNLVCADNVGLKLCADGSFEYTPDASFDGFDSFQYKATALTGETATGTVILSACSTGAVSTCWHEAAFRAKISGYTDIFREGFEGSVWNSVRAPTEDPTPSNGILSKGISWTTNFPLTNGISTSSGAERSGFYGGYDPTHGDPDIPAPGIFAPPDPTFGPLCIDVPEPIPDACFYHDGLSGSGAALVAVGGYFSDIGGTLGNISVILDADPVLNIGKKTTPAKEFFGVIKTAGFSSFEFREVDGKYGQAIPIYMDDFIIATTAAIPVETNISPVLATIGNQTVDEGMTLEIILGASDSNVDDGWTFSSSTLPTGATIVDNEDGTSNFSWTPDFSRNGVYPVTFTVTDNGFPAMSSFETISITVNDVNRFPVVTSSAEISVIEGDTYSYRLTATDEDVGDTLTYADVSNPALPSWLSFYSANNELRGTAPASEVGSTINVKLQVSDGKDTVNDVFPITVNPVNSAPVADNQNMTTTEDTAVAIILTGSDLDGDPVTFAVGTGPGNGSLSGTAPNLTYTPNANFNGSDSFTYIANDGLVDSAPATVSITVNVVDTDTDGYADDEDAFPNDIDEWLDTDLDGVGDNADTDDDNDNANDDLEQNYNTDGKDDTEWPQPFDDVINTHRTYPDTLALHNAEIIVGCGNNRFCPTQVATKDMAAIWLLKAYEGGTYDPPDPSGAIFNDISTNDFAAEWIEDASTHEIVGTCDASNNYCPHQALTKGYLAKLLLKAKYGIGYVPDTVTTNPFTDIDIGDIDTFGDGTPDADWIVELDNQGYADTCDTNRYCPNQVVTLGDFAKSLARTFNFTTGP